LGLKITPTLIPSSNFHLLFHISSALGSLAKLGPQDMESGLETNASLHNKVNGGVAAYIDYTWDKYHNNILLNIYFKSIIILRRI